MLSIGLGHYLTLAAIIFTIGIVGIFLNRKNVIVILMSIELILLAVNINLVSFSIFLNDISGQIFTLFILTVAAAEAAFEQFSLSSKAERLDLLARIRAVTERRFEELAQAMRLEMGAPISMSRDAQADAAIGHLDGFVAALEKLEEQERFENGEVLFREPIGVCGLITPWNWPMNQVTCKVAPALAVGCTMVLKPSEVAPLSSYIFAEIMHEAGVPAGVFNMVNGDGPGVGTALSKHPDVDMMSFTGSTRAGSLVAQNAAPTVKRVTQELGGKSPNIILNDADLEAAVTRGVLHMYNNTGQSCNAPSRMLVPRDRLAEAEQIAAAVSQSIVVGDTASQDTNMGPVVSKVQWDKPGSNSLILTELSVRYPCKPDFALRDTVAQLAGAHFSFLQFDCN